MGNVLETTSSLLGACGISSDDSASRSDSVIIRCLKPKQKMFSDLKTIAADTYEEDLSTSRQLLRACSPVFTALLTKTAGGDVVVLKVDKFSRDHMALFLRFASLYALPTEGSVTGADVDIGFTRKSIAKVMPIVYFYSCDVLWSKLVERISASPKLELLVQAETISGGPIEWTIHVLRELLSEIITSPASMESITVSKGLIGSEPRGTLQTGAILAPNKIELLGNLNSRTVARVMELLVQEKLNARVECIGSPGGRKIAHKKADSNYQATSISGGRLSSSSPRS